MIILIGRKNSSCVWERLASGFVSMQFAHQYFAHDIASWRLNGYTEFDFDYDSRF